MGQLTLPLQREWQCHVSSRKLPSIVLVVLCAWLGIVIVSMTVVAIGRSAPIPPNPFASFADVFPGQPRSAITAWDFSCVINSYAAFDGVPNEYCTFNPATGTFSQVRIAIYKNVIQSIVFVLRENTLTVGDLMLLWGRVTVRGINRAAYFYWHRSGIAATAVNHSGQFSLLLPVRSVTIAYSGGQSSQ
jgi:hypothetical protein